MSTQTLPQAIPFGICSRSLGRSAAGHLLPTLLQQCADKGFWAVEIAYECLEGFAKTLDVDLAHDPRGAMRQAARETNALARSLNLVCVALDAFENYEGLRDRARHASKVDEFRFWIELCGIMGIDMVQVPANYLGTEELGDLELVVSDLRELCDIGLESSPPVKIAYEPMSWSTHVDTWEKAHEVCRKVGRSNIGLCLDTFHTISLLWGDPSTHDGLRPGGEAALRASLDRLRAIPASDIILLQLSDGALLEPPMPDSPFREDGIDDLFAWSKHGRPFPGEGYFPVNAMIDAVFATGYRGITVMEVFEDGGLQKDATVPEEYATRAVKSWGEITKSLGMAPHLSPVAAGINKLGTCTVNLGHYEYYALEDKLYAAAATGHRAIDLYEDDFLHYVSLISGSNKANLWEPNKVHLDAAKRIGSLCGSLGMEIVCFQPLIDVEGLTKEDDRKAAIQRVKNYFPYMRALRTDVTYITTNRSYDFSAHTGEMNVIAKDLAFFADLAAEYSAADGGPLLKIGYEHLSWGSYIDTFDKTWEVIALANRPNLGFVFDTFNFLAVEYGDPYNPNGSGLRFGSADETKRIVRERLAKLVKLIPGDKIYVCQVADAALVDPKSLPVPTPASEAWTPDHEPPLRAWSSSHRLFPNEKSLGGYMPVDDCLAAILATGYKGALTLEVFNDSFMINEPDVVVSHAKRSMAGISSCVKDAKALEPFW